ncbi:uncharacterized protein LOC123867684 [Maniola jurtina]|uniref:uncharacterized protein LOC123867684 n=1 Tax=Maniola jurtina TaxID=191418 RepID=UPI001E6895A1|nr:uncharacterized protein LOC123867684 [Maniola jurtina]
MDKASYKNSTREGPASGESLGASESRSIGPIVYGGANRRLMGVGARMGDKEEGNVLGETEKEEKRREEEKKEEVVMEIGEIESVGPREAGLTESVGLSEVALSLPGSDMIVECGPRSDSDASIIVSGPGRLWQLQGVKRPRLGEDASVSTETDDEMSEARKPRRRGRPPAAGKSMGSAKAKAELARKRRQDVSEKAEEELLRASVVSQFRKEQGLSDSSAAGSLESGPAEEKTVAQIQMRVQDSLAAITTVATKSGHLKGTFVRVLKDAVVSIKEAVEVLSSRTMSEETKKLQAENTRLQAEMASLRKEIADIKRDMESARKQGSVPSPSDMAEELPPVSQPSQRGKKGRRSEAISAASPIEEICRSVMVQVGEMLNARLASFEDRLLPEKRLRPPLAADKKEKAAKQAGPSLPVKELRPTERTLSGEELHQTPPSASSFQPPPKEGLWERVGGRKKGKKGKKKKKNKKRSKTGAHGDGPPLRPQGQSKSQPQSQQRPQPLNKARKLRPPRSAAIVITLQPGAEEKGASYSKVIQKAKENISLSDFGVAAVRFKVAATGARILELPAASGGEKADALAHKIREVVGEEFVRVSRPTKCVDIRVSGLDDSVTSNDVVTTVARIGGCSVDQVRAGEVVRNSSGLGTIWLRCPVMAAKKVVEGGRLLVGWVSARVNLLDERPQRCYRCLERGHLRAQCIAETDRSDTCYRCGQIGHKAKGCSAAPHCSVCAAAGRPADHRGGSGACNQPRKSRMKSGKADDGPRVSSQSAGPSMNNRAEEVEMAVG